MATSTPEWGPLMARMKKPDDSSLEPPTKKSRQTVVDIHYCVSCLQQGMVELSECRISRNNLSARNRHETRHHKDGFKPIYARPDSNDVRGLLKPSNLLKESIPQPQQQQQQIESEQQQQQAKERQPHEDSQQQQIQQQQLSETSLQQNPLDAMSSNEENFITSISRPIQQGAIEKPPGTVPPDHPQLSEIQKQLTVLTSLCQNNFLAINQAVSPSTPSTIPDGPTSPMILAKNMSELMSHSLLDTAPCGDGTILHCLPCFEYHLSQRPHLLPKKHSVADAFKVLNPNSKGSLATGYLIEPNRMALLMAGGEHFARLRYNVAQHLFSGTSKTHRTALLEYNKRQEKQLRKSKVIRNLMRCAIADIEMAAAGSHFETLISLLAASDADVGGICHGADLSRVMEDVQSDCR